MNTITLYRPVGLKELELIFQSGWKKFPPRLEWQPMPESYYSKFDIQNVGGIIHNELWVPAEELEEFNQNIDGPVRLVEVYFGDEYSAPDDPGLAKLLLSKRHSPA